MDYVDYGNVGRIAMYKRRSDEAVMTFFDQEYQRLASVEFSISLMTESWEKVQGNVFEVECLEGQFFRITFEKDTQKKHFTTFLKMLVEGKVTQVWNLEV